MYGGTPLNIKHSEAIDGFIIMGGDGTRGDNAYHSNK